MVSAPSLLSLLMRQSEWQSGCHGFESQGRHILHDVVWENCKDTEQECHNRSTRPEQCQHVWKLYCDNKPMYHSLRRPKRLKDIVATQMASVEMGHNFSLRYLGHTTVWSFGHSYTLSPSPFGISCKGTVMKTTKNLMVCLLAQVYSFKLLPNLMTGKTVRLGTAVFPNLTAYFENTFPNLMPDWRKFVCLELLCLELLRHHLSLNSCL